MKKYLVKKSRAEFRRIESVKTGCAFTQEQSDPDTLETFEEIQAAEKSLKNRVSRIEYDPYHRIYVVDEYCIEEVDITVDEYDIEDEVSCGICAFSRFPDEIFYLGGDKYIYCEDKERFELVEEGEEDEE